MQLFFVALMFIPSLAFSQARDAVEVLNSLEDLESRNMNMEVVSFPFWYIEKAKDNTKAMHVLLEKNNMTRENHNAGDYYLHNNHIYIEREDASAGNIYMTVAIEENRMSVGKKSYDALVIILYMADEDIFLMISFTTAPLDDEILVMVTGDIEKLRNRFKPKDQLETLNLFAKMITQFMILDKFQ